MVETYEEWLAVHGGTHAHCPDGCEHPQPFCFMGKLYCTRCWVKFGEATEMVPCTPDVCKGESYEKVPDRPARPD